MLATRYLAPLIEIGHHHAQPKTGEFTAPPPAGSPANHRATASAAAERLACPRDAVRPPLATSRPEPSYAATAPDALAPHLAASPPPTSRTLLAPTRSAHRSTFTTSAVHASSRVPPSGTHTKTSRGLPEVADQTSSITAIADRVHGHLGCTARTNRPPDAPPASRTSVGGDPISAFPRSVAHNSVIPASAAMTYADDQTHARYPIFPNPISDSANIDKSVPHAYGALKRTSANKSFLSTANTHPLPNTAFRRSQKPIV